MGDTYVLPFSEKRVRHLSMDPNPIFGKLTEREVDILYNYMTAEGSETRSWAYEEFWTSRGGRHREVETIFLLFDRFLNYNYGVQAMNPVKLFKILDQFDFSTLTFFLELPDSKEIYRTLICAFSLQMNIEQTIAWCNDTRMCLFDHFSVHLKEVHDDNEVVYDLLTWIRD